MQHAATLDFPNTKMFLVFKLLHTSLTMRIKATHVIKNSCAECVLWAWQELKAAKHQWAVIFFFFGELKTAQCHPQQGSLSKLWLLPPSPAQPQNLHRPGFPWRWPGWSTCPPVPRQCRTRRSCESHDCHGTEKEIQVKQASAQSYFSDPPALQIYLKI